MQNNLFVDSVDAKNFSNTNYFQTFDEYNYLTFEHFKNL